jgi:bud site selection protein 31
MPKTKTSRTKPAPAGFTDLEPQLEEFDRKMREIEEDQGLGKRKNEMCWPIFQIHHQRSRWIYDLYYKRKTISKDLYDYCLKQGYGDAQLIAKWKKSGYENLCCLRCIQPRDTNFGTTCVCRVPRRDMEDNKLIECKQCGYV